MRLAEEVAPHRAASLTIVLGPKLVMQHPRPWEASASTCHACFVAEFAVLWQVEFEETPETVAIERRRDEEDK